MKRLLLLAALAGTVAAIAIPAASASVHVLPLSAQPNGWTYHQWHAIYNRRFLQRDFRSLHALNMTRNGQCGQKVGQVKARLLPFPEADGLSAQCRIEPGTRLVVNPAGYIAIYGGPERLKAEATGNFPLIGSASITLDGRPLTPHVIQTPFVHAKVPYFNAQEIGVPKGLVSFISRDYFAILSPISAGLHTLSLSAVYNLPSGAQQTSVTFWLNVG
jgi:hypothetical protein